MHYNKFSIYIKFFYYIIEIPTKLLVNLKRKYLS